MFIDRKHDGDADTEIVVTIPSKRRSANMSKMLGFFPDARVYVDELEKADYLAAGVPPGQLFLHPSLPNQVSILKWILDRETAESVLFCDDDLQEVASFVETHPKMRKYKDPADLARIVRNMANLLCDLGLGLGGWNMMAHPGGFSPITPFGITGVIRGAMLFRGRELTVNTDIVGFDMDLTLQSLMKHRIILKDMRFYWNFGQCQSNLGGNQSVETGQTYLSEGRKRLLDKWGDYIKVGNLPMSARMAGGTPAAVQQWGHSVSRKNPNVKVT